MKKYFMTLIVGLCLLAPVAWAEMPLTPETAAKMQKVIAGFSELGEDIAEPDDGLEGASPLTPEGRQAILSTIKASPDYAKALKLVKANGFVSLESFFDFAARVSAASIAYGLESNGMGELDMDMSGYLENLKQQGIPPEMLAQIQAEMASTLKMTQEMNAAAKAAKPEDIAAIKKYPEILQLLDMQ